MAQYTKIALVQSFIKLLNETPMDKITVKDIVEDCGVNRNTFYYYFSDIYAILEEVFISETQVALEGQKNYDSWQESFLQSIKFAVENRKAVYHVYNSMNREQLDNYVYNVTFPLLQKVVEIESQDIPASDEDKEFIANFYTFAIMGMLGDWISNGMKEPQLFVSKISFLFDGAIKNALEKSVQKNS
jgi:probable dihydroxyacetone kinase regulator